MTNTVGEPVIRVVGECYPANVWPETTADNATLWRGKSTWVFMDVLRLTGLGPDDVEGWDILKPSLANCHPNGRFFRLSLTSPTLRLPISTP